MRQSPQVLVFPPIITIYFCNSLQLLFITGFLSVILMAGFARRPLSAIKTFWYLLHFPF